MLVYSLGRHRSCRPIVNCKYLIIHSPRGFSGFHWLGDFARLLKVQFTSNEGMSNDAPIHECKSEIDHYTGHYVPYSLRRARVCGFFNVPQIYYMCKGLWDGAYGLSSLSEKTRKSNGLQISLQRQHFLISYLKTLGPAWVWTYGLTLSRPALIPLS